MGTPPNPPPENPPQTGGGTPPSTQQEDNSAVAAPTGVSSLQAAITAIEQIGVAAASPFIHSPSGQATEQKVVAEVNLGVAAIPLLDSIFNAIFHLFHHAKTVAAAHTQNQNKAASATTEVKS